MAGLASDDAWQWKMRFVRNACAAIQLVQHIVVDRTDVSELQNVARPPATHTHPRAAIVTRLTRLISMCDF